MPQLPRRRSSCQVCFRECTRLYMCTTQRAGAADVRRTSTHTATLLTSTRRRAAAPAGRGGDTKGPLPA